MPRPHLCVVAAVLAAAFFSCSASGQTYDWINSPGGFYSTPANWNPLGPPPAGATARFALNSTYSVTFDANAQTGAVTFNTTNATFFLNGFTFETTLTNLSGMGGDNTTGFLRLVNGSFLTPGFTVGGNPGSNATLTLDTGTNMTVSSGVFQVGNNGTGTLFVRNGATLTTADTRLATILSGIGQATVTGSGSTWNVGSTLRIGVSNSGTLSVLGGGAVTASALNLGEAITSSGSLTVSGAGSVFTTGGTANVGGISAGTPALSGVLTIGGGATVNLNGTTNLRTTAAVNMNGGTLNLASLNVASGAAVNWSAGTINFANGSSITAPVLDLLLAGSHTIGTNRTLSAAAGLLDLGTGLAVNGGSLSAHDLAVNAPLSIGAFGTVSAANALTINPGSTVVVEDFGALSAGSLIENNGLLQLNGPLAEVSSFVANNFGVIQGTGRFAGGMNLGTGGTLRARAGDHIIIEQSGMTSPGRIELSGGTVEYTAALSNLANGFISGHGEFRGGTANPGGNGLSNLGVMAFSGGPTDIRGDVNNSSNGTIVVSGGSVLTFYDDLTHNGAEIRTNSGSRTVLFGGLSGSGPFTGTGTVEINGDLRPGNSPGILTFEGEVILTATSSLTIELAGLLVGSQHDQIVVNTLSIGGTLDVDLIGGFVPEAGDSFHIMRFSTASGTFGQLDLPSLDPGLQWDVSGLYTTGMLNVIPEPASMAVTCLAGLLLVRRRRPG